MTPKLTIGWLYPELMSTYGDRGNIICLTRRCFWRKIAAEILRIDEKTTAAQISSCDLLFGGGAQDRQQTIVVASLLNKKSTLKKMFENNLPGLFVCGSPQLLGHYYETAQGKQLPGLGIFDMVTKTGFGLPRLIGNLVADVGEKYKTAETKYRRTIVGFENHSGRTFLGTGVKPLAKVIKGFGNNGQDKTEGAVFHNCLATYSHGPFLPKNPHIADWLLKTALEVKYGKKVELRPLDDILEWQAHQHMLRQLGVRGNS